jgi:phosphoglycolate phosphatase
MAVQANRADRLLIFDLDGTLYDTRTSFVPTMRIVYAEYGLPYPSDAVILGFVGEPFPVFLDWLIEHGFPTGREALAQHISEIELASIRERGALFPGVRETLGELSGDGYVICLCTNGDRRYAEAVLSTCGVLHLFAELETNEVEGRTKADLVRDLLRRVPHKRAFMIGDRYHDMEAGRANGCTVIAAGYGYAGPRELDEADLIIERFPDLLRTLASNAADV